MSIRTRQLKHYINKIIEAELKSGRIPSYEMIMMRLRALLLKWQPGTPTMNVRLWTPNTRCNVAELNKTVDELYDDLTVLYDETGELSERILLNFRKSQLERNALRSQMTRTEDNLLALLMRAKDAAGLCRYYMESFPDAGQVDLVNSTAIIDLEVGTARLPHSVPPSILSLTADMISVSASHDGLEELAPFANALDGKANTAWLARLPYKAGEQHIVTLNVDWSSSHGFVALNHLLLQCHMVVIGDILVRLHTPRGWVTIDKPNNPSKTMAFSFDDLEADSMEISIAKQEADDYSGNGWCVFGFNNIICSRRAYEERAEHISLPIPFDKPVRQISLSATTTCPHNTTIDFYVACGNDAQSASWHPISVQSDIASAVPKVINLGSQEIKHAVLNLDHASRYESVNGVQHYRFGEMPEDAILFNSSLRLGYRQVAYTIFSTNESRHSIMPIPADFLQETVMTTEQHAVTSTLVCHLYHAPVASIVSMRFRQTITIEAEEEGMDPQEEIMEIELTEKDFNIDKTSGRIYLSCLEDEDITIENDAQLFVRYNYVRGDWDTKYVSLTPNISLPQSENDRYCYGRMSLCMMVEDYRSVPAENIGIIHEGVNFAMYVNGRKVSSVIHLEPGLNTIDCLICVDREVLIEASGETIVDSFYLGLLHSHIASSAFFAVPYVLRYVHPEVMFGDILPDERSAFTVVDGAIISNMSPPMQAALLEYQSAGSADACHSVIVKAVLQRRADKHGVTPELRSYTVIVS